jgi:hypothetical protein
VLANSGPLLGAVSTGSLPHRSHEGSITRSAQRNSTIWTTNNVPTVLPAIYCASEQENASQNESYSAPVEMATLGNVRHNQVDHVLKGNPLKMSIKLCRDRQSAKFALLWGSTEIRQNRLFYTTSLHTPMESRCCQSTTDPHR